MCTHKKKIINKYTGKSLYVDCGHCHTCQQKKADSHLSRILNFERDQNYFRIFVTLNYCNEALPYIDLNDSCNTSSELHVYRLCRIRYHHPKGHASRRVVTPGPYHLGVVPVSEYNRKEGVNSDITGCRKPTRFPLNSAVGVLWTPDFSLFIRKLRQYLKYNYKLDVNGQLYYYKIGEYGPTTFRPHFHAILYFPFEWSKYYVQIRRAIVASWPFASSRQISENIGIASSGQRYVSQYCVRPSEYPPFLSLRKICQKPSFTRGYGYNEKYFSSSKIKASIERRDFSYSYSYLGKDGILYRNVVPLPQYIVRRYFPRIKGLYLLSNTALLCVLQRPSALSEYSALLGYSDSKEVQTYIRRLETARFRLQVSSYDYSRLYLQTLSSYNSYLLRYSHSLCDDLSQYYDNPSEIDYYRHTNKSFDVSFQLASFDCNLYPSRIIDDISVEKKYQDFLKRPKIVDKVVDNQIHYINYKLIKLKRYGKHSKKTQAPCAVASSGT